MTDMDLTDKLQLIIDAQADHIAALKDAVHAHYVEKYGLVWPKGVKTPPDLALYEAFGIKHTKIDPTHDTPKADHLKLMATLARTLQDLLVAYGAIDASRKAVSGPELLLAARAAIAAKK